MNRNSTTTRKPHNRLQETEASEEQIRRAIETDELSPEQIESRISGYLQTRRQSRKINADSEEGKASSIQEAVVKTSKGLPDMRFAENRIKFMRDSAAKVNGRPDNRFVENRPDIMKLHVQRGEDNPNVIFGDDGEIEE